MKPTCSVFFKQVNVPVRPSSILIMLATRSRLTHTGVVFQIDREWTGFHAYWRDGCTEFDWLPYLKKHTDHWNTHIHIRFLDDLNEEDVLSLYALAQHYAREVDTYDFRAFFGHSGLWKISPTKDKLICSEFVVRLLDGYYDLTGDEIPDLRSPVEVKRSLEAAMEER